LRRARQVDDGGSAPAGGSPGTETSPTPPTTPDPSPLGSFLGVTASDSDGFRLTLSRPTVAAGMVTIELRNDDSGPHDLVVRPEAGGAEVERLDPVAPGAVDRKDFALVEGRWYLFCSLDGHEAAGMHATVRAE
jgi:hypothetical protein